MEYKYYREVQAERAIQGNFASGQINFKFDYNDGHSYWTPSKSYLKIKMRLRKGDDTRVDKEYGVALNMYVCDNLFQQLDIRCNGVCVSEWNDYIAQCASLKNRMYKSMNKRNAIMSSTNYAQIYINDRIMDIASDGLVQQSRYSEESIASMDRQQTFAPTTIDEAADTLALGADDGIFTYVDNAGADLDIQDVFSVGDVVKISIPNNLDADEARTNLYTVTATALLTVTVTPIPSVAGLAANVANHAIFNIRKVPHIAELNSQQANDLDLIWKPPLGWFDINDEVCGTYKFELTPHAENVWQKFAVEGLSNRTPLALGEAADVTKYKVEVTEIIMYLWTSIYASPKSGSKSYTYSDIRCNSQNLTTNSLTSKNFSTHPNSHSYTLAYQDAAVGDDITLSRSKFVISGNEERNLVRFYLSKGGIQLPDPIPRLEVNDAGGINNIIQRYYETLQYSGGYESFEKHEKVKEWLDAGLFLHYKWGKGYRDTDQIQVYSNFSAPFTVNPQILLFDWYYCHIQMNIVGGKLISVTKS